MPLFYQRFKCHPQSLCPVTLALLHAIFNKPADFAVVCSALKLPGGYPIPTKPARKHKPIPARSADVIHESKPPLYRSLP